LEAPPETTQELPPKSELEKRLATEQKKLALVQEISRALSSALELDRLLALIMEKVTLLMEADRSTLYLLTPDKKQLWAKIFQGDDFEEFRLNVGEGIAGWVAASGDVVNIPDAYTDKRFQPAVDLKSGYRTRSILCAPMRDSTGNVVGVLQVLNKTGGPFLAEDEELLTALSSQAAISIENSMLYQSMVDKNVALLEAKEELQQRTNELNLLYETAREMNEADDLDELLSRLLHRTMMLIGAESGTVALVDDDGSMRFRTTAGPAADALKHQKLERGAGVIGWVVENAEACIVNEPARDPRHDAVFAAQYAESPSNLMCAPLVGSYGTIGAIELLNKEPGDDGTEGFREYDLKMMTLIAGQAARVIQVARSKQEKEEENRLSAIGQMLAGVLHDLKTPMTIISGYAQLMAQMEDADQRGEYVDQILRQFDLMSGMTRAVLAFARGESNVLVRKVYLHRFLDQVKTQLDHAFSGRHITLETDFQYTGVAFFDEQAMLRLIHNLARNAADAMGGRGTFRLSSRIENESVCFDFTDNGPGIPPELEGRLFDLFASGTEGGTGLGLAICKKITDEHEGEIWYTSTAGTGTTFHVRLPGENKGAAASGHWPAVS